MERKIQYIKLDDVIMYANNPRHNDGEAVDKVAASIQAYGFKVPMVLDKNNVIITGHTRYRAAKKLKLDEVPCIIADDLTDAQVKAFRIADNKVAEYSSWDNELLSFEFEELKELDFDIAMTGFEDFEINSMFDEQNEVNDTDIEVFEDDYEEELPEEPRAKLGDIYQLGNHRLMCGSSTSEADIKKLMNGEHARILFTSPPYSDMREYEGGKNLDVDNVSNFIKTYRPYTNYQCVNLGIQRKDHEIYPYWDEYIAKGKECGYKLMAWNVWDKTMCGSIGQQSAFFPIRHEWVFVFGTEFYEINKTWEKKEDSILDDRVVRKVRQKDGTTKYSSKGDGSGKYKQMESVLPLCSEVGKIRSEHPAVFPVGLPSEYIKAMTNRDDIVIEPFCGSGTTLIACEQLGRRCFGMELEPKYISVIIDRYIALKGSDKDVFLIDNAGNKIPYKELIEMR